MSHLSDQQLSMLIDGELSLGSREAAGRHMRDCPRCAERLDDLVEVAAELRLAPALGWEARATERVMVQLDERKRREWSTPIAAALAVGGVFLLALELPAIGAATSLLAAMVSVLAAFLPTGVGLPGAMGIGALMVVAVLGPLVAMPLARPR